MKRARRRIGDVIDAGGGRRYVVIQPISATTNHRRRQILCWLIGASDCQTVSFGDDGTAHERDELACIDALYWLGQRYLQHARQAKIERTRQIWLRCASQVATRRTRLCRLFGDDPRREPGQKPPVRRRLAS